VSADIQLDPISKHAADASSNAYHQECLHNLIAKDSQIPSFFQLKGKIIYTIPLPIGKMALLQPFILLAGFFDDR